MTQNTDSSWLNSIVSLSDGYETEAVERFTQRMIALARNRLPNRLSRRVDPEDIVQSALNSFFKRNNEGQFTIKNSNDLWRLLAAITYHKVLATIEFHSRRRRDYALDADGPDDSVQARREIPSEDATASAVLVMTELMDKILDKLPEVHQRVFHLRLENYSIEEIANQISVSTRTVNRAIKNIRMLAEQHLKQNDE